MSINNISEELKELRDTINFSENEPADISKSKACIREGIKSHRQRKELASELDDINSFNYLEAL